ncbi:MAG: DNA translocase FtsK 4TM domain-containing protein [Bacteroidota bacterium]
MARKKKQDSTTSEEATELQQEQMETTGIKELVRDERTHKIAGFILLLLSVFLFLSFTSYLFSWKEDQDMVMKGTSHFLFAPELEVANLMGRLGAWSAHHFFYASFGVASYLFCSFFFVLGVNLLFDKRVFSVLKNIKYILAGLIIFPVFFSFFLAAQSFPWGGMIGNYAADLLNGFAGKAGTAILLVIAIMSYVIWRFNPVFKWPEKKIKPDAANPSDLEMIADPLPELNANDQEETKKEQEEGNGLINAGIPLVIQQQEAQQDDPLNQFSLTEKEEVTNEVLDTALENESELEPVEILEEVPGGDGTLSSSLSYPSSSGNTDDLQLEIKTAEATKSEETANHPTGKLGTPYDPFLDLKDYKFPSLDLLENHGSEKIVQDPAELENYKNQIINTLRNYDI